MSNPVISVDNLTVGEADGFAEFVVRLNAPSTGAVSVSHSNSNGTAANGSDYIAVSGSKRWTLVHSEHSWLMYPAARGDGMRRFSEFRADDDGTPEDRERFALFDYAPRIEFELHP